MNKSFRKSRRALAIPIVLLIVLCVMIMSISVFYFRKESKQQNVNNFHFLRVNFLAQSATQHMLLKLSCLPQEAYDSGVLRLGYCPFKGIIYDKNGDPPAQGNQDDSAIKVFYEDCNTDAIPWHKDLQARMKNVEDNKYEVESLNIISAYNNTEKKQTVLTAQIVSIGEAKMEKGNAGKRKERLEKVIQLTGAN